MHERHERLARALVSALVSTLATACAHDLGGGHYPHPVVMGLVFAVAVPLCLVAGGRRVTLATLASAVAAAQVLLHAAFTFIAPQVTVGALSAELGTTASAAHAHHLDPGALQQAAASAAHASHAGASALPATHMLGTHLLAGAATLVVLRSGWQALRRMSAALALATADAVTAGRRAARAISAALAAAAVAVVEIGAPVRALLFGTGRSRTAPRWARRVATGSTPVQLRSLLLAAALVLRGPPAAPSPRFHPAA
ncbi:hypothetical protein [Zhihengliuella salsuginis]|uniref:Energy-coupling factor transport system permease protein n=1 Tax=Zhihengliuella salsuginis TaxID=578222 RepID=A0ABQ3GH23_9MICC|nr:hypothetical protein [Zhihengliuella salsuginis]GHD05183.1 hypothetical protein GCM10008096_13750 [Zhihengliuella salsuginis]